MMDYSKLECVKLEDTGIIFASVRDVVYNYFCKNGIYNLKDLFVAVDNNCLDFPKKSKNQIIGVIKLLKYKYLGEELDYLEVLNGEVVFRGATYIKKDKADDNELENDYIYFQQMGFSSNFTSSLRSCLENGKRVIDGFHKTLIEKPANCCIKKELECNLNKLELIIEWYNYRGRAETICGVREQLNKLYDDLNILLEVKQAFEEKIDLIDQKIVAI